MPNHDPAALPPVTLPPDVRPGSLYAEGMEAGAALGAEVRREAFQRIRAAAEAYAIASGAPAGSPRAAARFQAFKAGAIAAARLPAGSAAR